MTIRTIHECDRCGQKCEFDSFHVEVGCYKDLTGSMTGSVQAVDLCYSCCQSYLRDCLKKLCHQAAADFVKWAREKPKPVRM